MVEHVAHVSPDLDRDQVVVVGAHSLQRQRQRVDRTAQLDDLPLEQVDALDVGLRQRREDVLFHRVDVGFHQIRDVEVAVHDVIGDRVHDRVGTQLEDRRRGVQLLAHPGQPAVLAVADRDHEIGTDEDHDLAGLDDFAGEGDGYVFDVVHGLEHQEQRLVVALQLGPLMRVHGVLDGQLVQAEHVGHGLHLVLVGFVQADPDERFLALAFEFVHLVQRGGVGVLAGQPLAVDVDAAVDHGPRHGDVNGLCVRVGGLGPYDWSK